MIVTYFNDETSIFLVMENIHYSESDSLFSRTEEILLPVDGSNAAARAATVAYELAEITKAKLFILHIINIGVVQQIATMSDSDSIEVLQRYMVNGRKLLDGYQKAAEAHGVITELILDKGLPSDKIIHIAREKEVDIIVMGSRGASGERRSGLGSSTERVVRRAKCAVLIVK